MSEKAKASGQGRRTFLGYGVHELRWIGFIGAVVLVALAVAGIGALTRGEQTSNVPDVKSVRLTCTGGDVSAVEVENTYPAPKDLTVRWTGEARGVDFVSYIVVVKPSNGSARQVAHKRITASGEVFQFVYDLGDSRQRDVSADAGAASLSFPQGLDGVVGDWTATAVVSVDGQDSITCE